jgi:hypothetical protein
METIDYSKSCVYGFMKEDKFYYIGSSRNLTKRFNSHKSHCNNEKDRDYNFSLYNYMRENGGFDAWKIVVICEYPECKSEEELRMYETEFCDEFKPILNKKRPLLTEEERLHRNEFRSEESKENIKQKARADYAENKDKYKLIKDKYREENAEAIQEKQSSPEAKIKQKEYQKDNKEKIKLYQHQKRQENYEKNHISHTCECGGKYVLPQITVHNKTKKHIKFIENQKI